MPRKPKNPKERGKPDARFEAFRDEWEQRRKAPDRGGSEWLVERPDLPVDPVPFLQTLRRLDYFTQDHCFIELHRHLIVSRLIDLPKEKWSLFGTKRTRILFELIEEEIAAGNTERQAIADAVAAFGLFPEALSFDAAWKRLERLLHEWRGALDRNRRKKV
jgi:hypothetical protein